MKLFQTLLLADRQLYAVIDGFDDRTASRSQAWNHNGFEVWHVDVNTDTKLLMTTRKPLVDYRRDQKFAYANNEGQQVENWSVSRHMATHVAPAHTHQIVSTRVQQKFATFIQEIHFDADRVHPQAYNEECKLDTENLIFEANEL